MTDSQKLELEASIARALILKSGMEADNKIKELRGEYPVYGYDDFERIIYQEGIGSNDVAKITKGIA